MLILGRHVGQVLFIGNNKSGWMMLTVTEATAKVKLGFVGNPDIEVLRAEIVPNDHSLREDKRFFPNG